MIHSLQSRQARREGDKTACPSIGTQQVTLNSWEVTCNRCKKWDEDNTFYVLSVEAQQFVDSLQRSKP